MAILDTIKENIETARQIATDVARRTADELKLRDQIRRDKKEIRKMTYEIGETYLRLHEGDCEEAYKDLVEGIAAAKADIEEKNRQLAQLREKDAAEDADIMEADEEEWDDLFEDETTEVKAAEDTVETAEEAVQEVEEVVETVEEETADL